MRYGETQSNTPRTVRDEIVDATLDFAHEAMLARGLTPERVMVYIVTDEGDPDDVGRDAAMGLALSDKSLDPNHELVETLRRGLRAMRRLGHR